MLLQALGKCPAVEVHNESADSAAFFGWKLRGDEVVRSLVVASRNRLVAFKPLDDSHRVIHLMTGLGTPSQGRAIWIYRQMEGRVRSTLARWPAGDHRVFLQRIAEGREHWQSSGFSSDSLQLVRSFDYDDMTQESAEALRWHLRNLFFFELGLAGRKDVALVSYDRLVSDPETFLRMLCGFLGITFHPRMTAGIAARPRSTSSDLDIDNRIRVLCDDMQRRLDSELERRLALFQQPSVSQTSTMAAVG